MPASLAGATPRYRPRPASNALKEIVENTLEELCSSWDARFEKEFGSLHPRVRKRFESFVRCGDLHFGFLRLVCTHPDCPKKGELLVGLSCKTRGLCPGCGQRRAIEWAARMVEEVLPRVPYRQLVFTIPRRLRKYFHFDRSLYGDLCRAAYAATRDFLREHVPLGLPQLRRAVPAMVIVPQSFGELLVHHPHAHALCSLGVFLRDGSFHSLKDVDFSGLEAIFRERVFDFMIKKGKITTEVAEDMRRWPHSGFGLDFHRKIEADDRKGLEGLLCYMDRPPVSLRRLTYLPDSGLVHYQGTRVHPRLGTDHQLLPAVDFLALLASHVLLRYQITKRCYGGVSTTFRKRAGWIEAPPVNEPPRVAFTPGPAGLRPPSGPGGAGLGAAPKLSAASEVDSEFLRSRRRGWAKLIARTFLVNPELCPTCRKPMKIVAAISSPAQDEVIEKLLRHLNLWAPPWKRQRQARGPPPPSAPGDSPAGPIDPQPDLDDYAVDPPWVDDL